LFVYLKKKHGIDEGKHAKYDCGPGNLNGIPT